MANVDYWIRKKQEEWNLVVAHGKRFEEEDCSGYIYLGKRHYDWIRGPTVTGPDFPYPDRPIVKSPNPWKHAPR